MIRTSLAPGYDISAIVKGGWQLAGGHGAVDVDAAMADMDRYVDAGVTTFDCADIYTGVEALIGSWVRSRPVARSKVQVHTKYVPDLDQLATHSRVDVVKGIDRSLSRLGVDALDVVQLHWWDYDVRGYVEAGQWLAELQHAGKIRHVGLTNFDGARIQEFVDAGVPIVSHQVQYSLLDRRPATVGAASPLLLCYGSLAEGFLSERWLGVDEPTDPLENRSLIKYRLIIDGFGGWALYQRLLRVLADIAARHAVGIGAVAMRWVLDQPAVAAVIVGVRHGRHLNAIHEAMTLRLDTTDRTAIAAVHAQSRGPMGEIYALERIKGGAHASIMRYGLNRDARSSA